MPSSYEKLGELERKWSPGGRQQVMHHAPERRPSRAFRICDRHAIDGSSEGSHVRSQQHGRIDPAFPQTGASILTELKPSTAGECAAFEILLSVGRPIASNDEVDVEAREENLFPGCDV